MAHNLDSLTCPKCKNISLEHQVCSVCHISIQENSRVTRSKRNAIEATAGNIQPIATQNEEMGEKTPLQENLTIPHKKQKLESSNEYPKAKPNPDKERFNSFIRSISDYDLNTLEERRFLNDTIIDVYLQYVYHELFKPDIQARSHIFSTHFFSSIESRCKPYNEPSPIFEHQVQWISGNMWTRRVDVFSKDFIFIPVHSGVHWSLIVLCYLTEFIKGPRHKIDREKYPCLYFFDSLDATEAITKEKTRHAQIIMEFLEMLWDIKYPHRHFDFINIFVNKIQCPQQTNGYDCGIYLLEYVETFFNVKITLKSDKFINIFDIEDVKNKRSDIKNLIGNFKKKGLDTKK